MSKKTNRAVLIAQVVHDKVLAIDFIKLEDSTILKSVVPYGKKEKDFEATNMEELNRLAVLMDDPWSLTDYSYKIAENIVDAYTDPLPDQPKFCCEYHVACDNVFSVSVFGFGEKADEALNSCLCNMSEIRKFADISDEASLYEERLEEDKEAKRI